MPPQNIPLSKSIINIQEISLAEKNGDSMKVVDCNLFLFFNWVLVGGEGLKRFLNIFPGRGIFER